MPVTSRYFTPRPQVTQYYELEEENLQDAIDLIHTVEPNMGFRPTEGGVEVRPRIAPPGYPEDWFFYPFGTMFTLGTFKISWHDLADVEKGEQEVSSNSVDYAVN
ncbi:hypothetical protein [Saccharopolyspora pogona]|uniref:hypothetical protein n=1 Tax=Saccharopolyspora pogona TaxID=333966 RepID=UPI0016891C8A|nr:hypothetical protein [Saccharopolyspora pogona]